MKKILLSLFCLIAVATTAFAKEITEELTAKMFGVNGASYKDYSYTSSETGITYGTYTALNKEIFQFKKTSVGLFISDNPQGLIIKKIEFPVGSDLVDAATSAVNASHTAYTKDTYNSGSQIGSGSKTINSVDFPSTDNYEYFSFYSTKNAWYVTKFVITYEVPDEPAPGTEVSAEDLTLEVGSTANISYSCSDPNAVISYEYDHDGLSIDEATHTLTGLKEGEYSVTINASVDGEVTASNTFNVTVLGQIELILNAIDPIKTIIGNSVEIPVSNNLSLTGSAIVYGFEVTEGDANGLSFSGLTMKALAAGTYTVKVDALGEYLNNVYEAEPIYFSVEVEDIPTYTLMTPAVLSKTQKAYIIISNKDNNAILGAQNNNNRAPDTENLNYNSSTQSMTPPQDCYVLLMERDKYGNCTFYDIRNNDYLSVPNSKDNYLKFGQPYKTASVSISDSGIATIKFAGADRFLKYNSSSKLFASYTSSQTDVRIYYNPANIEWTDEYEMYITTENLTIPYNTIGHLDNITFTPALNNYTDVKISYERPEGSELNFTRHEDAIDEVIGTKPGKYEIIVNFEGTRNGKVYTASETFFLTVEKDENPEKLIITTHDVEAMVNEPADLNIEFNTNIKEGEIEFIYDSEKVEFLGHTDEGQNVEGIQVIGKEVGEFEVSVKVVATRGTHDYNETATFKVIVKPAPVRYSKLTSLDEIEKSANIIIAAAPATSKGEKWMMGEQNGSSVRTNIVATDRFSEDNTTLTPLENDAYSLLVMSKNPESDGNYSFKETDGKYMTSTSEKSMSKVNQEVFWTVEINDAGNAILKAPNGDNTLQANSQSPRFTTYSKLSQQPIQIYYDPMSVEHFDENDMTITAESVFVPYQETIELNNLTFSNPLENYSDVVISYTYEEDAENPQLTLSVNEEGKTSVTGNVSGIYDVTAHFSGVIGEKTYTAQRTFALTVGQNPAPEKLEIIANDIKVVVNQVADLDIRFNTPINRDEMTFSHIYEGEEKALELLGDTDESKDVEGLKVKGLKVGTYLATIKVVADRGDRHYEESVDFYVTVQNAPRTFEKVTTLQQLGANATVVITAAPVGGTGVNKDQKWVMSNNAGSATGTRDEIEASGSFAADNSTLTQTDDDDFAVFELVKKSGVSEYALREKNTGKYLISSNQAFATSDDIAYWTASMNEANVVLTYNGETLRAYSSGATTYFKPYTNAATGRPVQLYMLQQEAAPLRNITLTWTDIEDNTLSGTVRKELWFEKSQENSGELALGNFFFQLNALENGVEVEEFPIDLLDVRVAYQGSKYPDASAAWADSELSYTHPGTYRLTVAPKSGIDFTGEWNVTYPKQLNVVISALKPDFHTIQALGTDHVKTAYEAGTHGMGEYEIYLDDPDTFFDEAYTELMEAAITPEFESEWVEEIHGMNEDMHEQFHYLYYADPIVEYLDQNTLWFDATVAGNYTLTIKAKEQYRHWFETASVAMPLSIVPTFEGFDIEKAHMNEATGEWTLEVWEKDLAELGGNVDEIGADHDYFKSCRFCLTHGGDLFYKLTRTQEVPGIDEGNGEDPFADPRRVIRRAASSDEDLIAAGYTKAERDSSEAARTAPVDLRNVESLTLVQRVNGVQSEPKEISFSGGVTTTVKEIEFGSEDEFDSEDEFYTLDGLRVQAPLAPGMYIRRSAKSAGVILVR